MLVGVNRLLVSEAVAIAPEPAPPPAGANVIAGAEANGAVPGVTVTLSTTPAGFNVATAVEAVPVGAVRVTVGLLV